jgi:murein DD-endopeptidase MepM/ murein hydrolase activator NlpD
MKKIVISTIIICLVIILGIVLIVSHSDAKTQRENDVLAENSPEETVREYQIKEGETFAGLMVRQGIPYEEALTIIESSKEVFDFTKVTAGKILKLVFVQEVFAAMEYPLDDESVVHVAKEGDGYVAVEKDIAYDVVPVSAQGTITDSLFAAAKDAGVEDKVILELADTFSWDIDFVTDIRSGDSFSLVYEKRTRDGKPAGAGELLAARFVNDGVSYDAYYYDGNYYDSEGKSLARQFLKSPLNYSRISSVFAKTRVNPVTKSVLPHLAIDYAAPTGTPIVAPASGKIQLAGRKGDLGIAIEIKHNNGYLTQYGHLSKIAKGIKSGVSVDQGDVIGYVGSTGRSTGPHLHYTMSKNGTKVNPLAQKPSRDTSVSADKMAEFTQVKEKMSGMLK